MKQIEALTAKLSEIGLKASAWRGQRIYLNGFGRDIKAFITLDEPGTDTTELSGAMGLFSGCALKVYSDAVQEPQWKISRAKQVKHGIMLTLVEHSIVPGPVCDRWQDVIL